MRAFMPKQFEPTREISWGSRIASLYLGPNRGGVHPRGLGMPSVECEWADHRI